MADEQLRQLVERLRAEQRERWQRGERVPAEAYLAKHPDVAASAELALELVYN